MKIHIIAKVGDFNFTKFEADECIEKAGNYDVKCNIMDETMAIFSTKYKLMLEGDKKDIEDFLNYLKMMGFKIKKIC